MGGFLFGYDSGMQVPLPIYNIVFMNQSQKTNVLQSWRRPNAIFLCPRFQILQSAPNPGEFTRSRAPASWCFRRLFCGMAYHGKDWS